METKTYHIDGMTCGGCTSSLEKLLLQEQGITSASASHQDNTCRVTLDPAAVSDDRVAEITTRAGFEFKGTTAE
jgi:copper chaperone CopZ